MNDEHASSQPSAQPEPTPRSEPSSAPPLPRKLQVTRSTSLNYAATPKDGPVKSGLTPDAAPVSEAGSASGAGPAPSYHRPDPLTDPETDTEGEDIGTDTAEDTSPPGHRYDHILPKPKRRYGRKILLTLIAFVAVAGGGYLVYTIVSDNKQPTKSTPAATNAQQQGAATETPPADASSLVDKKSDKLGIQISARKDWTIKEDSETGFLTVTSPKVTYSGKDGASHQGNFILKFQKGADNGGIQTIHTTTAAQDSETIAYSAPTDSQRYYTNLTIGGTGGDATFILVTSSNQYHKGESISSYFINGDTYLVIGGYHSTGTDSLVAFDSVKVADFTSSTVYTQATDIIKSLKIF